MWGWSFRSASLGVESVGGKASGRGTYYVDGVGGCRDICGCDVAALGVSGALVCRGVTWHHGGGHHPGSASGLGARMVIFWVSGDVDGGGTSVRGG